MEKETGIVATEVLHLMKRSLIRIYILLIIFIVLFTLSMIDSIYQRCKVIDAMRRCEDTISENVYICRTESEEKE